MNLEIEVVWFASVFRLAPLFLQRPSYLKFSKYCWNETKGMVRVIVTMLKIVAWLCTVRNVFNCWSFNGLLDNPRKSMIHGRNHEIFEKEN